MKLIEKLYYEYSEDHGIEFVDPESDLIREKLVKKYGGTDHKTKIDLEDGIGECMYLAEKEGFKMGFTYATQLWAEVRR